MSKNYYLPQSNEVELFKTAAQMNLPVLIKGPTGCGKTRFIESMGEELGRDVYTVVCHDDLSAADLIGRHLIDENGTYWQDGPLTKAVRNGGICYLDEIIEARKDTTVVLHSLADYRRVLSIDRTGETIEAHPDFMLVVSYNPGYQNVLKGMKPSTKQRFISLSFDYPKSEIEKEIIKKESGVDEDIAQKLVDIAKEVRQLTDVDIQEAVSTRLLIYAGKLITKDFDPYQACMHSIVESLSDEDEVLKVLEKLVSLYFPRSSNVKK
ncbi:CbbQ/NirQ/NorQ/GpvN family protein [Sulfurimonas sp. CVO]|jgi:nitric oxide reductase NorQ protein|uniref:CbbQ/NirQ/NorQ/GpvN family protein n=1 Tax=Sulfurimonas xiamenensis TaxID=2590021 RepID=A0AAJ4A467_9BACT|nr:MULTISPECIES: CbbQ/NirQ/NorQ/GpvN family protein [Sulfurimonas]QFR43460.1 CbbQ/NirQ/NorQ/GpvN family protein [Sulfurimonas xiamenensis]QHG90973.1 CbbQ/NirQ/NorQ/GpvN family protein [Sulfurimonas sp. CVO]